MYHILIGSYEHETNTATPDPTGLERFGGRESVKDPDGARFHNIAYREILSQRKDIHIISTIAAEACPWGKVRTQAHRYLSDLILDGLKKTEKIDGILLSLHGAMVTEDSEDGEGDLLEEIRTRVGEEVPIGVVVDLHANITRKMVKNATWIINYDTYPHVDADERAQESARIMLDVLDGKIKPVMACVKVGMLPEFVPTTREPAMGIQKKLFELEKVPGILSASVAYGFFCADIHESGSAVIVIADQDRSLAEKSALSLAKELWDRRTELKRHFVSIDEALDGIEADPDIYPCVIADCCDNPGGGATGSSTHILRRIIERKMKKVVFAYLFDPESVKEAERSGVGTLAELELGGKLFPEINGPPIKVRGYVKSISDGYFNWGKAEDPNRIELSSQSTGFPPVPSKHGKTAAIDLGGITVLLSSIQTQTWNDTGIRACGIDPEQQQIIVVKSTAHFRKCFERYAKKIYEVRAPGLSEQLTECYSFVKTRRPVYPLDQEIAEPFMFY